MNWQDHWVDMPEFHPPTRNTELRNQTDLTDIKEIASKPTSVHPKYPIYIISKGRYENPITAKALDKINIDYKIVVEPTEYDSYTKTIDPYKILVLPFHDLGQGSIPARNWVLDHANGKHWILDDNINGFGYQKCGKRVNSNNGDMLRICEDFVDRYNNVALAGLRYRFHHNYVKSPFYMNTRIYSCILMNTSYRWRGKYNEDTDLSLRLLKSGYATVLFTWCYCNKAGTMTIKGGNTDTVYNTGDDRLSFAESLHSQHPDVVKVTRKFNRWHHKVDYTQFKNNPLINQKSHPTPTTLI